jgi:large subunit ribosomal protein L1
MKTNKRLQEFDKKRVDFKGKSIEEVVEILRDNSKCKFDETIDLVVHLNINPKKTDQAIKGRIVLPQGSHKKLKVMALVSSDMFEEAKKYGADIVGNEDLVKDIKENQKVDNIDVCITTPAFISKVAPVAQILGKAGLMPSTKAGTVLSSLSQIVDIKNSVSFKNDHKQIYVPIGKSSFTTSKLSENIRYFIQNLKALKPASVERLIKSVYINSTMSGKALQIPKNEIN